MKNFFDENPHDAPTMAIEFPRPAAPLEAPRPFSSTVRVEFGALSHAGAVRPNNEDAYIITRTGRYWERVMTNLPEHDIPARFDENGYSMAVADGMGGAAAGEVASSLALKILVNLTLNAARWIVKLDNPDTRVAEIAKAKQRAEDYFRRVDEALLQYADAYPRLRGMGTTLTGAYTFANDLFILHIGDSRAYMFRDGKLETLTHDQTVAQYLADIGQIAPEDVSSHRLRHTLTSCLGGQRGEIQIDVHHHRLNDGDRLMFCTDGLHEMVKDEQIAAVLQENPESQKASEKLVDLALQNGGKDNVTVIVAAYTIPKK